MKNDCEQRRVKVSLMLLLLWSIKIHFYANKCFSHSQNNKINQILIRVALNPTKIEIIVERRNIFHHFKHLH